MTEPPAILPAVGTAQVEVGHATPVELAVEDGPMGGGRLIVRNTGSKPIYIGNVNVTSTTGFELKPEDPPLTIVVSARARLFAVCAGTDTSTAHILRS